jgi:uncharacterized phage protein (TIGR02216 family)
MSHLNWAALMRAGLYGLHLHPEQFWALTPAELQMMLGETARQGPLLSSGLQALMSAYPDETEGTEQ